MSGRNYLLLVFTIIFISLVGCSSIKSSDNYAPAGLAIATTQLPQGTTGVSYSATVTASGGTAPYTFAVTSGALPDGLSLDTSTGQITGTPTTGGTFNFTVTVTDDTGTEASKSLSIIIKDVSITTNSLPGGQIGISYSATLAAEGANTPFTWAVTSGSLPSGLSLNMNTGVISGTPDTIESPLFIIQVTDSLTATDSKSFSIDITADANTSSGGSGGSTGTFSTSITVGSDTIDIIVTAPSSGYPTCLKIWLHGDTSTPSDFPFTADSVYNGNEIGAGWVVYRPYAPDHADPDIAYHWWQYSDNIQAVLAVVEHAKSYYDIYLNRIYLAGFSGGASTTSIVGRAHGEIFAACGMHCGLPMGSSTSTRKAPFYVYCGSSDPMYIAYPNVDGALIAAGHEVEYLLGPTGHMHYQPAFDANYAFFLSHTK